MDLDRDALRDSLVPARTLSETHSFPLTHNAGHTKFIHLTPFHELVPHVL